MRLFVTTLSLLLLGSHVASAQGTPLPCGAPTSRSYRIRWHPLPNVGQGLTEFVLMRFPEGGEGQSITIPPPLIVDGYYTTVVDGFTDSYNWSISMFARGPGGDSEVSNTLQIPALVSGVACPSEPQPPLPPPSGPPSSPVLLDIAERVEADAFLLREQALRLEEQARRLREQVPQP